MDQIVIVSRVEIFPIKPNYYLGAILDPIGQPYLYKNFLMYLFY